MSEKPTSTIAADFDPFDVQFDPLPYSRGRSHFQSAFRFVWNRQKKRALEDFYAFCRIADDIADEAGRPDSERLEQLNRIKEWIDNPESTHPFWIRLAEHQKDFSIPPRCLRGLIHALEFEVKCLGRDYLFDSWDELESYIQGVAGDVGESVLCILGAKETDRTEYARQMGRCVQFLNILRDLEEDYGAGRIYVPKEYFGGDLGCFETHLPALRTELHQKALRAYQLSRKLGCRSWIAELMINFYISAAKKNWIYGRRHRLSRWEKAQVAGRTVLQTIPGLKFERSLP